MQACDQVIYLVKDNIFILKLIGTLRFTSALYLESAFDKVKANNEIIIDMRDVKYVDSTILGCIVKGFRQDEMQEKKKTHWASIVCQNQDVIQSFNKIGFDKFFNIVNDDIRVLQPIEDFQSVEEKIQDEQKLENCVLQAHQTLYELQPMDKDLKLIIETFKSK